MHVLLVGFFLLVSTGLILDLRRNHASAVAVITFLFWLTTVLTPILTMVAVGIDAIGPDGMPLNGFGSFLKNGLLKHSYDLLGGISFYLSIFSLVVVPQAASFVCCGVFGCASPPKFVSTAYSIAVWGAAKTFTIGGGVLLSFTTYVHFAHPDWIIFSNVRPTPDKVLVSFSLGAAAFSGALLCLWIGFGCQFFVETVIDSRVGILLSRINKVAHRYQSSQ